MIDYNKLQELWDKKGVFDLLTTKYIKEIKSTYNWDNIHKELDNKDPDTLLPKDFEEDDNVYSILIGTVFTETPSGKYYMPWACSNVTPKEVLKDEIWQEALEAVLEDNGLFATSGEGDPCDMFFCKVISD